MDSSLPLALETYRSSCISAWQDNLLVCDTNTVFLITSTGQEPIYTSNEDLYDARLCDQPGHSVPSLLVATATQLRYVQFAKRWKSATTSVVTAIKPGTKPKRNTLAVACDRLLFLARCSDAVLLGQIEDDAKLTQKMAIKARQCEWMLGTACVAIMTQSDIIILDSATMAKRQMLLQSTPRVMCCCGPAQLSVVCEPPQHAYSAANADLFLAHPPSSSAIELQSADVIRPALAMTSARPGIQLPRTATPDLSHLLITLNITAAGVEQQQETLSPPFSAVDCMCPWGSSGLVLGSNSSGRLLFRETRTEAWRTMAMEGYHCAGLAATSKGAVMVAKAAIRSKEDGDLAALPASSTKRSTVTIGVLDQLRRSSDDRSRTDMTTEDTMQQLKRLLDQRTEPTVATQSPSTKVVASNQEAEFQLQLPGSPSMRSDAPRISMLSGSADDKQTSSPPSSVDVAPHSQGIEQRLQEMERAFAARMTRLERHVDQRLDRIEATLGLLLRALPKAHN
eukprot:TRINITY_DN9633_c0_g1_i3.p1 TRINITY_DN9633_c0_g1~~TRINITY_DN9633_c0_g1_i3.p1  ORF type:complete len:509 (+),score=61.47 TRINITY_DN9633_c0_g1_i3:41-1567(+)